MLGTQRAWPRTDREMMIVPSRVVDLHIHLFNARYVPLGSIIAHAMNVESSPLADAVAALLERLAGSSYPEQALKSERKKHDIAPAATDYIELIWRVTELELLATTRDAKLIRRGALGDLQLEFAAATKPMLQSDLVQIIDRLAGIDYSAEGFDDGGDAIELRPNQVHIQELMSWARKVVTKALAAVSKRMDSEAWGEREDYLEFFFTMLYSEEDMFSKVIGGYGAGLPEIQVSHYMMDMQYAYERGAPPYYPFLVQLDRMQSLHRNHPDCILSFSAFDPRRADWLQYVEKSISKGFVGFKFYPAMGYKPAGHENVKEQRRINDFFEYCAENDIPIFTHCTPQGFQNRHRLGLNANPAHWESVLKRLPKLRLCFGHAGGGRMKNGGFTSAGWEATEAEWKQSKTNYAKIVAGFCRQYPNVYCEFGYITSLLKRPETRARFLANIEAARQLEGDFDLMTKVAYGSDWHMPSMVDNTRKYIDLFLEIFQKPPYDKYVEHFFWRNAYAFLGLDA